MPRILSRVLPLLALPLLLLACSDDDGPTGPRTASMNWVLYDLCDDGLGLQARIFDVNRDLVWPSETQVFVADPGDAIDVSLSCTRGSLLCYGAATDPDSGIFWGVDVDGSQNCQDCCERCASVVVEFELTC